MADTVNLVLYPQIQEGANIEEVKEKLCKTLNVDLATVSTWYDTESPTAILKDVDSETAAKYEQAIRSCGAECNLQPSGGDKSGWGLEEMTAADINDLFICPSCEHEELLDRGIKVEQCPSCGLVIAKWEEKMREEAEKEKIRRRLLRDQRMMGDRESEFEAQRAELERLRALEREIMAELGIRPPSQLWLLFEKYTISLSFAISACIIMATGFAFKYVDTQMDQLALEQLRAEEASEEIKGVAPMVAAAIELQTTGNEEVVAEIADVSQVMRGNSNESRDAIVGAAAQMMKGVDPEKFLAIAANMTLPKNMAKISEGEMQPAPVNLATIGGVSNLQGMTTFSPAQLLEMSPPLLEHGQDQILNVLTEKRVIRDVLDPDGADIIVDAIDEMDGSMIVNLMSTITRDQEWDQFLLSHVKQYIRNGEIDAASALAGPIKNPVVRISAFGSLIEEHLVNENAMEIKVAMANVRLELENIKDPDAKARVILELGERLALAGSQSEPYDSIEQVNQMIVDSDNLYEQAFLSSRLAVAYLKIDDMAATKRLLKKATTLAGQLPEMERRISAFTRIAQRYYDVRNNTLASEILNEAAILSATELEPQTRSIAFAEIAVTQAYIGDFVGARISIDNASEDKAKQQLMAKVAEMLIGEKRYYEAMSWMESLEDEVEHARLELRLSSTLYYVGRSREAINRIEQSAARMQRIYELSERGLLTSQYARFYARFGNYERSEELFDEAEKISSQLTGRKSQVALALVAIDRARVFQLGRAKSIVIDELTDAVVRDPIDTEVLAIERIVKNLLPASVYERVEQQGK